MSDAPWRPPDRSEILSRIGATDSHQLSASAATMEKAADECQQLTGRMRGIRAGVPDSWTHGGVEEFLKYSSELIYNLSESTNAVRTVADQLRSHAAVADEAKQLVFTAGGLAAAQKYDSHPGGEFADYQTDAIERFHRSEQRVREALWKFGEIAPGKIPLPQAVPLPKETGWYSKLDPSEIGDQYWVDSNLDPHPAADVYDERHKLYGYDEDGNLVPAFMADPMRQRYVEGGVPLRGILQLLRIGGRTFENVEEATAALRAEVAASYGFRASHIDRHIREFFNLGKASTETALEVYRQQFLDLIEEAIKKSDRVFRWDLKSDVKGVRAATNTIRYREPQTGRWIFVQFYADGERAGEFATAFMPTRSQMLRANRSATIVSGAKR